MLKLKYCFAKLKSVLKNDNEIMNQYYRSGGGKNWKKLLDLYSDSPTSRQLLT